jgi:transcriptional regulator with XRE-family HTH domain
MKSDILVQFGSQVRKLRIESNMSQYTLSAICDLDRNYIGMIERGQRNPSLKSIEKIALGLQVSIFDIFKNL